MTKVDYSHFLRPFGNPFQLLLKIWLQVSINFTILENYTHEAVTIIFAVQIFCLRFTFKKFKLRTLLLKIKKKNLEPNIDCQINML